jgi:hypothetical protein
MVERLKYEIEPHGAKQEKRGKRNHIQKHVPDLVPEGSGADHQR